jgi:Mg/Co/Ni transporter MgtE
MADNPDLTLAFLAHAPQSAAQVLEEIEPEQAAAFLEDIPARIAAMAVGYMSSWTGARCIERLTPPRAAAILTNLQFHDCAGLVRLVAMPRRNAILENLPGRLARRLRNALTYPAGSVGAWIDPEIPAFAVTATVGDALRYLETAGVASHVFLHTEDGGRFAGSIPVTTLMRSRAGRVLSELPVSRDRPLSSRAMLASVAFLEEWDEFLMLPVIGRQQSMVGGLSRASLRKGMHEYRNTRELIPGTITGQLLSALATTCSGLLHLVANGDRPPARQEKNSA